MGRSRRVNELAIGSDGKWVGRGLLRAINDHISVFDNAVSMDTHKVSLQWRAVRRLLQTSTVWSGVWRPAGSPELKAAPCVPLQPPASEPRHAHHQPAA